MSVEKGLSCCTSVNNPACHVVGEPIKECCGCGCGCDSKVKTDNEANKAKASGAGAAVAGSSPYDPKLVYTAFRKWEDSVKFSGVPTGDGHVVDSATGQKLWDLGMCSYLGLEKNQKMMEGSIAAIRENGLYTSASREYMELPLQKEVETMIGNKMGGYFLLLAKAHTGSMIWATAIVQEGDTIVLDREAHVSVHYCVDIARARGRRVVYAPYGDADGIASIVSSELELNKTGRVWFATDGVHSMKGTSLSSEGVSRILAISQRVSIFVDDSHGFGWVGKGGCGYWLNANPLADRMVVVLSFAKAACTGGGGILFKREEDKEHARISGLPGLWTGPPTPGELGALKAFVELIDTPEGQELQRRLARNISLFNERMKTLCPDVPVSNYGPFPIKDIHVGKLAHSLEIVKAMRAEGFWVCPTSYPFVPRGHAGIRITFNASIPEDVIIALVDSIKKYCIKLPPFSERVHDEQFD